MCTDWRRPARDLAKRNENRILVYTTTGSSTIILLHTASMQQQLLSMVSAVFTKKTGYWPAGLVDFLPGCVPHYTNFTVGQQISNSFFPRESQAEMSFLWASMRARVGTAIVVHNAACVRCCLVTFLAGWYERCPHTLRYRVTTYIHET